LEEQTMRIGKARQLAILTILVLAGTVVAAAQQAGGTPAPPPAPPLKLTSSAFTDGSPIPTKFTCSAQPAAVSPALEWSAVPKDTVSFTLIVHDLDPHPKKSSEDVLHWIAWNIPGNATRLPEGVPANADLPDGTRQGNNISGATGFRGPCPPPGQPPHHYTFELYALDQKLDLPASAKRAEVLNAMDGHIIGHGVLIGLFHR
jgi:Raf kinase inhibitor-like YbhB/YbcL family protein